MSRPVRRGSTVARSTPNPVVCGRKFCAYCGHWRHACDFQRLPANKGSGLDSYCAACRRIAKRRRWAHITPAQRALQNEYRRIRDEAKRRERGVKPRNFRNRRTVVDRIEFVGLPTGPLVSAIERVGLADIELGAVAGVPPRSVFRLRQGQELVRIDLADKLAQGLGVPLATIYGDQPAISIATGEPV